MSKKANPLEVLVEDLSDAYHLSKKAEAEKEALRLDFFKSVTDSFSKDDLAEDIAVVDADNEEEAMERIQANYPAYLVEAVRPYPDQEGKWEGIIVENPEFKSFSISIKGEIWQRRTSVGSPTIDAEKLEEEDPELFERATFVPEPERQMKPLKDIDKVALARLQRYVVSGKVSVKLPAPKVEK